MNSLSLGHLAELAGGRLLGGRADTLIERVSTDSRTLGPGSLFVALKGERFDGHDFVETAKANGASALMLSREVPGSNLPVVRVEDTLLGLQALARGYRQELSLHVVMLTGSNGKTSTKDMVAKVLGARFAVSATKGNLNNHIGLPLTVLAADSSHQFGVWEIGMNHSGELSPLVEIGRPKFGIITNIGTAHIGHMGSREAIAREKGVLAEGLPAEGVLFLPAEDDFADSLRRRTKAKIIDVGFESGHVRGLHLQAEAKGTRFRLVRGHESVEVHLPIPGRHMVCNALLAAAVGLEAGIPMSEVAEALGQVSLAAGRLQTLDVHGVRVINDAYNANPDSMRASLTTVSKLPTLGKRFAILGAMGELGEESQRAHQAVGQLAAEEGFDYVCSVGERARDLTAGLVPRSGQRIHHFQNQQEAADFLRETAKSGDVVLLKGSRSAALEQVHQLFVSLPS